jgi:putative nucleotidyltransferase with HDIG domain
MSAPPAKPAAGRFLDLRLVRRVLGVLLLAAVAVSAAFLLTPSRFTPSIPGDEALGTTFVGTLKAHRDYDVPDPETTATKREEAARSVWPVYDFDGSAVEVLQHRVAQAFEEGRAAIEEWKRDNPGKAARVAAAELDRVRQGAVHKRPPAEEGELLKVLLDRRDELWKTLQAVVDDEDYLELARAGFDPAVERAAVRLAGLAGAGFTVAERGLLAADRERGIVVRTLPQRQTVDGAWVASPPEKPVRDIDRIRDLAQARSDVERLAGEQLGDLPAPTRRAVAQVVRRSLQPNLSYDDGETRRREAQSRAQVKDVLLQVKRGEKIIGDGEQVTKAHLLIFGALRAAGRVDNEEQVRWGGGLFAALVCGAMFAFGRRNVRKFRLRMRDAVLLAALLIGQLLLVRGSLWGAEALHDFLRDHLPGRTAALLAEALPAAVPFALGSLLVRFLLYSEAALLWTAAFAPLCGLLAGGALQPAVMALIGGVVAADRIGHAGSRGAVFRAGLWTGAANVVVLGAWALFQGRFFSMEALFTVGCGLLGGALLVPVLAFALAPLLELCFGYVTDIRLLELASFNHPVLKDLIVQAPGTYHHSIVIGRLVEAAAREIGANPLLSRVGAYYHDIGKGKNPLYFGENQNGQNRHDALTPSMSALLIKRHVTEGMELAAQAKLPRQVIDFIPQHHGTRVIGYFHHRAREDAERAGQPPPAEAEFRYPGPRPQTREAALVMIADMVVATSRNLASVSPGSLRALVDRAIQSVVAEGQLDECEITLRDLERTARSFAASLEALYAARADLPQGPATAPRPAVLRVIDAEGLKRASE